MDVQSLFAPGGVVPQLSQLGQDLGSAFREYGDIRAKRDAAAEGKRQFDAEMQYRRDKMQQEAAQAAAQRTQALEMQQRSEGFQRGLAIDNQNAQGILESQRQKANLDLNRQKDTSDFFQNMMTPGRLSPTPYQQSEIDARKAANNRENLEASSRLNAAGAFGAAASLDPASSGYKTDAQKVYTTAREDKNRAVDTSWHTTPRNKSLERIQEAASSMFPKVRDSVPELTRQHLVQYPEDTNIFNSSQAGGEAPAGTTAPSPGLDIFLQKNRGKKKADGTPFTDAELTTRFQAGK